MFYRAPKTGPWGRPPPAARQGKGKWRRILRAARSLEISADYDVKGSVVVAKKKASTKKPAAAVTAEQTKPAPAVKKEEPAAKAAEPAAKKEAPAAKVAEPAVKKEEPVAKKAEPAVKKEVPAAKKAEPAVKKEEPAAKKAKPAAKPAAMPFTRQMQAVRKGLAFHRVFPPGSQPRIQAMSTTTPNTPPR